METLTVSTAPMTGEHRRTGGLSVDSDIASSGSARGGWIAALGAMILAAVLFLPLPSGGVISADVILSDPERMGAIIALVLAAAGFWGFRKRFWPGGARESRRLQNGMVLALLQAIVLRAAMEAAPMTETESWGNWLRHPWLSAPWFVITGFAVILLGGRFGVLASVSGVFFLYLLADPGPLPLAGCLISSLAGTLLLRRCATRHRVLWAGVWAGVALGGVGAVHGLLIGAGRELLLPMALAPVIAGLVSGFVVLAFLPMMEWVLGELSDVTLVEYGTDHRLLDELRDKAPGTWHHTVNVADLAERAAAAIGARALFCKTASLYHDIGKLKNPASFAENLDGPNPHDDLDPRESARLIIGHVTNGLEIARKRGLPKPFREIIAEHHGVSVVRSFYAKACASLRPGETPESLRPQFCYPGPPPGSKESGIIALADTVEAATRSVGQMTEHELRGLVHQLVADRLSEGELSQCPLTLAELARVEESFVGWLKGRNHQRPAYPKASETSVWRKAEAGKTQDAPQPA